MYCHDFKYRENEWHGLYPRVLIGESCVFSLFGSGSSFLGMSNYLIVD